HDIDKDIEDCDDCGPTHVTVCPLIEVANPRGRGRGKGHLRGHYQTRTEDSDQQQKDREQKLCYICHKPGHIARECRHKPTQETQPSSAAQTSSHTQGHIQKEREQSDTDTQLDIFSMIKAAHDKDSPTKPILINGKVFNCLCDTGACTTVLRDTFPGMRLSNNVV
uniref:CCHC-type domain-containing protein n=1 Tax=Amphiprion ocellaris TaxID=80972 RepID=A0A3Q1BX66_AMPOC